MRAPASPPPLVGIFVGGLGTRLGGVMKGNLRLGSGRTLLERLLLECDLALPGASVVLVGRAEAYATVGRPALLDEPAGVGPLGGLRALLLHARGVGASHALALSCDLPYLGAPLIGRLASEAPHADLLAPRDGELWQTLVARYSATALSAVDAALAAGEHALQRVVRRLGPGAVELTLTDAERLELRDWDTPDDAPPA